MQSITSFNWVDYIVIAIFLISILIGLGRGFVKEVISIITWIAAFIVASMFANQLATFFTSSQTVQSAISSSSNSLNANTTGAISDFALGLSFLCLFVGTLLVGGILNLLVGSIVATSVINRLLGAVFGFFRGVLINLLMMFLVQLSPLGQETAWQQSYFVNAFQPLVTWLNNTVQPGFQALKEKATQGFQNMGNSVQGFVNTYTPNNQ